MGIPDVSSHGHGEREEHYRKQFGMYELPLNERPPLARLAWEQATAEMLDEIHGMLRHLTGLKGDD